MGRSVGVATCPKEEGEKTGGMQKMKTLPKDSIRSSSCSLSVSLNGIHQGTLGLQWKSRSAMMATPLTRRRKLE